MNTELLENPWSKESQTFMSRCIETHKITGQDLGQLLGLKSEYTTISARTEYWRGVRDPIIYDMYTVMMAGYTSHESAYRIYDWITRKRKPFPEFQDDVDTVLQSIDTVPMKLTSPEAFHKKLQSRQVRINKLVCELLEKDDVS